MPSPPKSIGSAAAALAVCLCLSAAPLRVLAQPGAANACPDLTLGPVMPPTPDRTGMPVTIFARELDATKATFGEARGNVEMFRADQHIATERVRYDATTQVVTVPGALEYEDQQIWFRGLDARYSFVEESGRFSQIDYGLAASSANGSAELAELVGGQTSILHRVDYTTCPGDAPDWQLRARELEMRHAEGVGYARGAQLRFKDVPILYAPWFTFPLDGRRKSGFLYPNAGHNSDTGFEIGMPWYWNIAPNQDATIEPHWFSRRGYMLSGQYRFLTKRTNGSIEADYLPHDRKTDRERYRYLVQLYANPRPQWDAALVADRVSDDNYYQDFGTSLGQTSRQFLRSSATLSGVGRYWTFELVADAFQVIDDSVLPGNEPYRRLPRILYASDRPLTDSGLSLAVDTEFVYFDRDVGVTGARVDLFPRLYWDVQSTWGFLRPSAGFRFMGYRLELDDDAGDDAPATGLPIFSLDSGLVFDRHSPNGNLQTLEPRLFYLYVPFEEQNEQPLFDTGEFTFGYSQLFNTNRFAGGDRQGDANQLSLGVSTRRFDGATGQVLWSLSLGQIVYFESQRVQLDNEPAMSQDHSPFLAEFRWRPFSRISGTAGLQWDWETNRVDLGMFGVEYGGLRGQRAAFEYRYRRDRVDQFDFRVDWPVSERWHLLSRVNYSFDDNKILEFLGGFEYESCCWAVRTMIRRYLKNRDGEFRTAIYLELNLKGLASIGTRSRELFPQ